MSDATKIPDTVLDRFVEVGLEYLERDEREDLTRQIVVRVEAEPGRRRWLPAAALLLLGVIITAVVLLDRDDDEKAPAIAPAAHDIGQDPGAAGFLHFDTGTNRFELQSGSTIRDFGGDLTVTPKAVPGPETLALVSLGLLGLSVARRRTLA